MLLDSAGLRRLDIRIPPDPSEVLRFAAAELCHYLQSMSGVPLAPRTDPSLPASCIALGEAPRVEPPTEPDSFTIAPTPAGASISASSDRAVLFAVYHLLERAGCRWSFHGERHEIVPRLPAEGIEVPALRAAPRYRTRAYSSDLHTWHYNDPALFQTRREADSAFTDWMGKTGANAFLFIRHPFDTQLTIPDLLPDFRRRGIRPEYGGHILPLLLPREEFRSHPDYFPEDRNGRRHDLGNLCTSNAGAMRIVADNAIACAQQFPEMTVLHIWGADLWHGGWCHCGSCTGLSAQDQSLRVCNTVAQALRAAGVDVPVCYLAYHDTIDPELTIEPGPNVVAEFAPRERCYGHALDDAACATNRRYRDSFERHVEIFEGRVRVFEYYGDSVLFCGCAVPLTEVIGADLDYYYRCGAREISFLQFGAHSLWAHALNFLEFAASSWGTSSGDAVEAYCRRAGDGDAARRYWRDLEKAMRDVVTYGDIRRPPAEQAPLLAPRIEGAIRALQQLRRDLEGRDGLAQAPLIEYTETVLRGVALQLGGGASKRREALACYERALESLRSVDPSHLGVWGASNLPVIHGFHNAGLEE